MTRVRTSACSLASSSFGAGRAFATTTAWLIALPSSPTDGCLLASIWDDAGNPCIVLCSGSCHNPSSQDTDNELLTLVASNMALRFEGQVPGAIVSTHGDTSAGQPRPYVSTSLRLQVFQSSSPSPSAQTTRSGHHVHFPSRFSSYATISASG
jgi:hypothetical protein